MIQKVYFAYSCLKSFAQVFWHDNAKNIIIDIIIICLGVMHCDLIMCLLFYIFSF